MTPSEQLPEEPTHEQVTALWVAAFFDELTRCGVRDVVVSPGSRSTALAMAAFELSRRAPESLRLYVDVDERGAAFLALGLAKASGRPAVCLCTSGTALANYYPAVIEAETSRVPLIVLSGDRPPHLQGLGAPQTTDQLKAYGEHVRAFRAMPLPGAAASDLAFVRQAAREACLAALGPNASIPHEHASAHRGAANAAGKHAATAHARAQGDEDACAPSNDNASACDDEGAVQVASRGCSHLAGPVHLNFPFAEPLKPDFAGADAYARFLAGGRATTTARAAESAAAQNEASACASVPDPDAFAAGRAAPLSLPALIGGRTTLDASTIAHVAQLLGEQRTLVLAGEGTCSTLAEAREVAAWAHKAGLPVLADPLSGLRSVDAPEVIDNYDNICRQPACPTPDMVIRFGRYPISKYATAMAADAARSIVVDAAQTRDFNCTTSAFVASTPIDLVRQAWPFAHIPPHQQRFLEQWESHNSAQRARILRASVLGSDLPAPSSSDAASPTAAPFGLSDPNALEAAYVRTMLELAPARSCVFSASSMSIRALDTFYVKDDKPLCVLCNRGQNGIDGTTSTALGAAMSFEQTTFLTGDFTFLHDISALALQRELTVHHAPAPSIIIVLLNNNGGAIFDMLPQASPDPYFERLFLAPQDVRFEDAARAFHVPYRRARTVTEFAQAYRSCLGVAGISLIEVRTPLRGVHARYEAFQGGC